MEEDDGPGNSNAMIIPVPTPPGYDFIATYAPASDALALDADGDVTVTTFTIATGGLENFVSGSGKHVGNAVGRRHLIVFFFEDAGEYRMFESLFAPSLTSVGYERVESERADQRAPTRQ